MGFLGKLFGKKEEDKAAAAGDVSVSAAASENGIAPEKVGLDGQFDEKWLGKTCCQST